MTPRPSVAEVPVGSSKTILHQYNTSNSAVCKVIMYSSARAWQLCADRELRRKRSADLVIAQRFVPDLVTQRHLAVEHLHQVDRLECFSNIL